MSTAALTLQVDIEIPDTTPPGSHEVRKLLDSWWDRVTRIVVKRFIKRGSYESLNSFSLDPAGIERSVAEHTIMGIAQDHWEENGSMPTTYFCELDLTNPEKKKNTPRKSCHFALGGALGEVWDEPDPGRIDVELMAMNRQLHEQVIEHSKITKTFGVEVVGRLTDALAREKEAIAAKAAADAELASIQNESASDKTRNDQIDNLLKLLEPAAKEVSTRLGVAAAKVFSGKDDDDDEGGDDSKKDGPRKLKAAGGDNDDDDDKLKDKHPSAYIARVFATTITSDQWFEVSEVFTKKQIRALREFRKVKTDDEAIEKFRAFQELLKDEHREKLEKLLEDEQVTMIKSLFVASAKTKGKDEQDDDDKS